MTIFSPSLYARSARGIGWALAWRGATRLLGLGSTLVLVRVLSPADFGLVALATSFSNAVEQFGWLGTESAIARERAPDRAVFDTGFTLNLARSLLLALLIAAVASPVASFLHEERLRPVLLWLAVASAVLGAENVGTVEFRRTFAFDKEFRFLLWPRLGSIALAIVAALVWRSYWALVLGIVAGRLLRVLFSYAVHPYRPRLSLAAWRLLAGYSVWTWLIGIASLLRERADTLVVGRLLATAQAGLYSVGFDLAALSFMELVEGLQRPAFSAFAAARHEAVPLREPLLRLSGAVAAAAIPIGLGFSLVAGPLIALLAGERWLAAIPVVQALSLCGPALVIGSLSRTRMVALGEFRTVGAVTLLCGGARVAAMLALVQTGGLVAAAAVAGSALLVEGVIFTLIAWRREAIPAFEGLAVLWRPLGAGAVMTGVLWATGLAWSGPAHAAANLIAAMILGAASYGLALALLWELAGKPDGAERDALTFLHRRFPLRRPLAPR